MSLYSIDLNAAKAAFLCTGLTTQVNIAFVAFLLIVFLTSALPRQESADEPDHLPGLSLLHIGSFFRKRYDFLNWGFYATGTNVFQLKLLRVRSIIPCIKFKMLSHLTPEQSHCLIGKGRKRKVLLCQGFRFERRLQNSFWSGEDIFHDSLPQFLSLL